LDLNGSGSDLSLVCIGFVFGYAVGRLVCVDVGWGYGLYVVLSFSDVMWVAGDDLDLCMLDSVC